jgi:hypothetical protein
MQAAFYTQQGGAREVLRVGELTAPEPRPVPSRDGPARPPTLRSQPIRQPLQNT